MENINLVNARLLDISYKELNVVYYTFTTDKQFYDLTSLNGDEITTFLEVERLNKIGSEITLIITKERPEVIGLINSSTSHMLLLKNKVEYVGVRTNYNYYERRLLELNLTRKNIIDLLKREEKVLEDTEKILTLVGITKINDYVLYTFKYYDEFSEERYATFKVNYEKIENLIQEPKIGDTKVLGIVQNGIIKEISINSKKRVREIN